MTLPSPAPAPRPRVRLVSRLTCPLCERTPFHARNPAGVAWLACSARGGRQSHACPGRWLDLAAPGGTTVAGLITTHGPAVAAALIRLTAPELFKLAPEALWPRVLVSPDAAGAWHYQVTVRSEDEHALAEKPLEDAFKALGLFARG